MGKHYSGGPAPSKAVLAGVRVLDFLMDLRNEMRLRNVRPGELAKKLGVPKSQVSRWLAAESGLTARSMFLLARGLDCELEYTFSPLSLDLSEEEIGADVIPIHKFKHNINVRFEGIAPSPLTIDESQVA